MPAPKQKRLLLLLIGVLAFLQYANTLQHEYVFDDSLVITENPHLKKGIAGIPHYYTQFYRSKNATNKMYRPVVLTAFNIEYSLFGGSPTIGHFFNILYFSLCCILLFIILQKIFYQHPFHIYFSFLVVLLFIVHPIHVEVVANIKSRDEIFCLLGGLFSIYFILHYLETNVFKFIVASVFAFIFAILSKGNGIVFLAIIPLVAWYFYQALPVSIRVKKSILISLPFIIFFVAIASYTSFYLNFLDKTIYPDIDRGNAFNLLGNNLFAAASFSEQYATAFLILGKYLKLLLIPYPLVYYAGFNQIPLTSFGNPAVIIALIFHFLLLGYAIYALLKKTNPIIAFGIFWYFISLSIYANLVIIGIDAMADRFLFIPSIGFCIVFVQSLLRVFRVDLPLAERGKSTKKIIQKNILFLGVFALIILTYSCRTFDRNADWKNNLTLFTNDMPNLQNCARAHFYLASAQMSELQKKNKEEQGVAANKVQQYRQSITQHLNEATRIMPNFEDAYLYHAKVYFGFKEYEKAFQVCEAGLKQLPQSPSLHYSIAESYYQKKNYLKAITHYQKGISHPPIQIHRLFDHLAWSYFKTEQLNAAIQTLEQGLQKFPDDPYFLREKGKMYFINTNFTAALPHLQNAYLTQPKDKEILHMLAKIYLANKDTLQAQKFAEELNALK